MGKDTNSGPSQSQASTQSDRQGTPDSTNTPPFEEGPVESTEQLKTVLQQMDPYEFEHFVADLWERMGWETEVSSASMDEGVDVVARKSHPYDQLTLIQAKRYGPNTTVGSPDIQQYASLGQQYNGVDKVVIVTTNEFTGQARDLAGRLNVKLINGDDLVSLLVEYDALDLFVEYFDFITPADNDSEQSDEPPDAEPGVAKTNRESNTDTSRSEPAPSTRWQKAILASIPGWFIGFFGVTVLPESLWAIIFFTVWLGLPIALFFDARALRRRGDWPKYWWAYVLTSLIWLFAIIPAGVYLWRRRSVDLGETSGNSPTETATVQSEESTHRQESSENATESNSETSSESVSQDGRITVQRQSNAPKHPNETGLMSFEYNGEQYHTQTVTSPNSAYTAAWQDGRSGEGNDDPQHGRVFLFEDDELSFTTKIARPNAAAVAKNGIVSVVDWQFGWGETRSGTLHVFNRSGHPLVKHDFDSNLGPTAITSDGEYAATSTYNPDCSTYIFHVDTGEQVIRHENKHGNVQDLEFIDRDGSIMLRLGSTEGDSTYGIDLGGHIVWKSDSLKQRDRLDALLERSTTESLDEARETLQKALDLASKEYEQRNVVQQLADTHWQLATTIKKEEGVTDEWWMHLDRAAQYYRQSLPRYAGKQGLAKVKRKQGTQHLNDGNETDARNCFEEIASLEKQYDVQLLTDTDKRRLTELA